MWSLIVHLACGALILGAQFSSHIVPCSARLTIMFCWKRILQAYFRVFCIFQRYVASVSDGCCKSRSDVAYVAMIVHVYCKGLLPMFYLYFSNACCKCIYLNVAYVSHIRYMCFIWLLYMVVMVFKCFQVFFQVFQKQVLSVRSAFICILQLLYLDVSKADRVLYLFSLPSTTSSRCVLLPAPAGHLYDAAAGSFRIGGAVPFPSCRSDGASPTRSARNSCLKRRAKLCWSVQNQFNETCTTTKTRGKGGHKSEFVLPTQIQNWSSRRPSSDYRIAIDRAPGTTHHSSHTKVSFSSVNWEEKHCIRISVAFRLYLVKLSKFWLTRLKMFISQSTIKLCN
jgi:hypothetical protein